MKINNKTFLIDHFIVQKEIKLILIQLMEAAYEIQYLLRLIESIK